MGPGDTLFGLCRNAGNKNLGECVENILPRPSNPNLIHPGERYCIPTRLSAPSKEAPVTPSGSLPTPTPSPQEPSGRQTGNQESSLSSLPDKNESRSPLEGIGPFCLGVLLSGFFGWALLLDAYAKRSSK